MKRREVIQLVALSTGAVLSVPLLGSLVSGCTKTMTKQTTDYKYLFFNENEFALVRELVDLILPKSDSPSASEVGVDKTIDTMLAEVYKKEDQENYRSNFSELQKLLANNERFSDGNAKEKTEFLRELNNSKDDEDSKSKKGFLDIRQQTIAYYLTTEEISMNYLNYLPIPGKYEPCISLEDVNNKAWAL